MSTSALEALSSAYDQAESAFLDAVREQADRLTLAALARATATAAQAFNVEAYRRLHRAEEDAWMPLDHLTERTELLAELWADLAASYES